MYEMSSKVTVKLPNNGLLYYELLPITLSETFIGSKYYLYFLYNRLSLYLTFLGLFHDRYM